MSHWRLLPVLCWIRRYPIPCIHSEPLLPPSGSPECGLQRAHRCVPLQQRLTFPKVRVPVSHSLASNRIQRHSLVPGNTAGSMLSFLQTRLWISAIVMFTSLGVCSNLITCSELALGSFSCVACPPW